jgi:isopenicillin N synthase-like dioxygenase
MFACLEIWQHDLASHAVEQDIYGHLEPRTRLIDVESRKVIVQESCASNHSRSRVLDGPTPTSPASSRLQASHTDMISVMFDSASEGDEVEDDAAGGWLTKDSTHGSVLMVVE